MIGRDPFGDDGLRSGESIEFFGRSPSIRTDLRTISFRLRIPDRLPSLFPSRSLSLVRRHVAADRNQRAGGQLPPSGIFHLAAPPISFGVPPGRQMAAAAEQIEQDRDEEVFKARKAGSDHERGIDFCSGSRQAEVC